MDCPTIYDSIEENNLELFMELYPKFINDSMIVESITYGVWELMTTEPPKIFYTYCKCDHTLFKCMKNLYAHKCNCKFGKKYNLVRYAYEKEMEREYNKGILLNQKEIDKRKSKYNEEDRSFGCHIFGS